MSISDRYKINDKSKKQSVELTRKQWVEVLLWLGPQDGNDKLYSSIENQVNIFQELKIYDLTNKSKHGILVVASSPQSALNYAVKNKFAKNTKNIKIKDITKEYVSNHSSKGFKIPYKEGQLYQKGDGKKTTWGH